MKKLDCIVLWLKAYEHLEFWEVEEWKSLTVLLLWLKTYDNLRFWKVEERKSLTVLLLWLKTYENIRFWEIEEGLYRFCAWKPMKTLSFGRSKITTLRFWTHKDQQSCAVTWFGGSRIAPGPANPGTGSVAPGPTNVWWCTRNSKSLFWIREKKILDPRADSKW